MKNGGMAFPEPERFNTDGTPLTDQHGYRERGMTLRNYFAAAALTGRASLNHHMPDDGNLARLWETIAQHSYEIADAMLKESDKHA